jgi:hypothetical protein
MCKQDELINYIQVNLQNEQIKTEAIRDAAVELYKMLRNRPPIESSNPIIGAFDENGNDKYSSLTEYYKDRERIEFLLFWVVEILPILNVLKGIGKLPLYRNIDEKDFEGFVDRKLGDYLDSISALKNQSILLTDDVKVIGAICNDLKTALGKYLEGLPEAAFNELKSSMHRIEKSNLEPLIDGVGPEPMSLFKMRLGSSNRMFSRDEMFHIPFENRGLVKTNRYSIPGLPCVYLGETTLTCWEEMGKPDLNTTHTSLFLPAKTLTYFDISIPPAAIADHLVMHLRLNFGKDLSELYGIVRTYLVLWPLIACCSIRVLNPDNAFKPEYIISQLLLQWIQQSEKYDGVSYFSTKIDNYSLKNFWVYRNFAFPVKERKGTGYCEKLRSKFTHITNATPWQVFQLHKGRGETAISERNTELEFMPGIKVNYNVSDFGRLETFLIHVMEAEMQVT